MASHCLRVLRGSVVDRFFFAHAVPASEPRWRRRAPRVLRVCALPDARRHHDVHRYDRRHDGGDMNMRIDLARITALVAAALGGFGLILWIAANWDSLGRYGRFALL